MGRCKYMFGRYISTYREMILICTSCYMRKTFINNVQWNNFLRCVFKGCNLVATKYWVYTILHTGCLVFLHNDCLNICYGSKNSLMNYCLKNDLSAQAFHICGISIAQLFCRAVINALDVKSSLDLIQDSLLNFDLFWCVLM